MEDDLGRAEEHLVTSDLLPEITCLFCGEREGLTDIRTVFPTCPGIILCKPCLDDFRNSPRAA